MKTFIEWLKNETQIHHSEKDEIIPNFLNWWKTSGKYYFTKNSSAQDRIQKSIDFLQTNPSLSLLNMTMKQISNSVGSSASDIMADLKKFELDLEAQRSMYLGGSEDANVFGLKSTEKDSSENKYDTPKSVLTSGIRNPFNVKDRPAKSTHPVRHGNMRLLRLYNWAEKKMTFPDAKGMLLSLERNIYDRDTWYALADMAEENGVIQSSAAVRNAVDDILGK